MQLGEPDKAIAAQRTSVDELRQFVRARHGGDCLAISPSLMLSKVMWKCSKAEHQPFEAVIAKVVHSGQWCPACWQERRTPPNPAIPLETLTSIVRDRGGEVVHIGTDDVWRGSKTRVLLRCANGHEWRADASNIVYAGSWCPDCMNKGERIARAIFEATFGVQFPKSRPDWLVSPKARNLELDGYNDELGLAFEYQGPHHLIVDRVKTHDEIKRRACEWRGIKLIEVEATKKPFPPENVLAQVVKAFGKYGRSEIPILPLDNVFAAELEQLRAFAQKKGGRLVSDRYKGGDEQLEWKCGVAAHATWWADPWRILKRGAWYPSCAGNRRLGIDGLRAWGETVGLELIDRDYRGGTISNYRWKCTASGHVIERSRTNILASLSVGRGPCPICAGMRREN
jgi:Probable Zinc-ribbon domain